jgi:hypothetical protein
MKKFSIILIGLMFASISFSQNISLFNRISETEFGKHTIEGYIQELNKMGQLDIVLAEIEAGTIDKYIETLKRKNFDNIAAKIEIIKNELDCEKLYFVCDGKIYTLTYEPTDDIKYGDSDEIQASHKNIYLYRRDIDGWKKASNMVREDRYIENKYMRTFSSRTTHWTDTCVYLYFPYDGRGSIHKTSNECVYITFETILWKPRTKHSSYNSIAVFVPNGDETYHATYFEPDNKVGKLIKDFKLYSYNFKKNDWNPRPKIIDIVVPILYGMCETEYYETKNSLSIRYWDGTKNNPIEAGVMIFTITANHKVLYNSLDGKNEINLIQK